jgi:hypothetical protein
MAEISILLKKETIFAYGENFNDTVRFLVEHYQSGGFTKFTSIYLKTQETYVN